MVFEESWWTGSEGGESIFRFNESADDGESCRGLLKMNFELRF